MIALRLACLALLPLALSLPGCTRSARMAAPDGIAPVVPGSAGPGAAWRSLATDADLRRLRHWRDTWVAVLPAARASSGGVVEREVRLFDPDYALDASMPPAGAYVCRRFRLGAGPKTQDAFVALPPARCEIVANDGIAGLRFLEGAQRPVGMLLPDTGARTVFLGSLTLPDDRVPRAYGADPLRDMAGYVERIGDARWRLALPQPGFGAQLDVIELVPADR